jgi:Mor family transcriptional regulator
LFKGNELAILDIRNLYNNEGNFNNRIQSLVTLIDEINIKELKKSVNETASDSVNILQAFLEAKIPN